jgi:hypothetical protein
LLRSDEGADLMGVDFTPAWSQAMGLRKRNGRKTDATLFAETEGRRGRML